MARTNRKTMLENLSERCLQKSFINESLNIQDELLKIQTMYNESEEVQEAINYIIASRIFETNYTKEESENYLNILKQNNYI